MKTANQELIDLLHGSDEFLMADLYTFTLSDGTVLRHTSADAPVTWQMQHYEARQLIISRGATRVTRGLEVDSNDLSITAADGYTLQGLPWPEAALGGALDGARVLIERAFFNDWQTVAGAVNIFQGRVSDVSGSRSAVNVTVKSDIELLNVSSPRNIYQAGCMRTLYDGGCKVSREAFTVTGRVTANSADGSSLLCNLPQPDKWFEQGVIKFTGGLNAGLSRTVKTHAGGVLSFALRLPHPPQAGDVFKIHPGCDGTKETCDKKFHNLVHFRGFPYIPAADTVT
ncbi:DUF2163 domain-containing protein [Bergeriella denitrificans]|uniref:Phage associated protein n=1 Tax=Bergeriella denitrificans TaxID=494 RepID=A0A378ULH6_BERDE|nr:DUF2163 domain-containing protein [Bergeriella denitrificans]STZ77341.1 phage associated protein [Bergeriella denitrificans]